MSKRPETARVTVTIPRYLLDAIEDLAKKDGITRAECLRRIIERGVPA